MEFSLLAEMAIINLLNSFTVLKVVFVIGNAMLIRVKAFCLIVHAWFQFGCFMIFLEGS